MKRLLLIVLFSLALAQAHAQTQVRTDTLTVLSFNIRCGSCEKPDDVNHWSARQHLVTRLIAQRHPDLIGLQEAELFQVRDLVASLSDYAAIAVGRDDGKQAGEATAILYRKDRFGLLEQNTLWLSPTPSVVGKGWDAALKRTLTYARLKDRRSGQEWLMLNTHFDHQGRTAQAESTRLIVKLAQSLGGAHPVIVTGDFNYTKASPAYPIIAGALRDAERVTLHAAQGGDISFNDFGKTSQTGNKIDFIFVSDGVDVLSHTIVLDRFDGNYASDHFPVEATLRVR